MFQTKVVEKIETHFLFSNFFSPENLVEKYCMAEQATDDNIAHAKCMLHT